MFEPNILQCRLCRKSTGPYVDIFSPKGTRGLIVWKVIKDLIQLDVCKNDMLPNAICIGCMDKVVDFRNFKAMCINSRIEFLKDAASIGLVESECIEWQKEVEEANIPVTVSGTVDSTCVIEDGGLGQWDDYAAGEDPLDEGPSVEDPLKENAQEQDISSPSAGERVFCDSRNESIGNSVFCVSGNINSLEGPPSETCERMTTAERFSIVPQRTSIDVSDVSSSKNADNSVVSMQAVEEETPGTPTENVDGVLQQYMERRLDEDIGSLKSCDAPNCRKVFSTYKALVIHKRDKHQGLSREEENASEVGTPAKRALYSQGGGSNNPDGREEVAVHIAEFACSHPSCGMKFTNLSFLLNHQTTHPQARDVDGSQTEEMANEGYEVLSVESWEKDGSGANSSGSAADSSGSDEGLQIVESSDETSSKFANDSTLDGPERSAVTLPEEPEYLCHAMDCGKAFFTYSRLVRHRKHKHSSLRGPPQRRDRKGSAVEEEKESPSNDLHCPASRNEKGKSSKSAKVDSAGPSGVKALRSCVSKREERKAIEKLRGEKLRRDMMLREEKKAKGKLKREKLRKEKRLKEEKKAREKKKQREEAKVKQEPVDDEKGTEEMTPEDGPSHVVDNEEFECQYSGCPRVFGTFKALLTHVSKAHGFR